MISVLSAGDRKRVITAISSIPQGVNVEVEARFRRPDGKGGRTTGVRWEEFNRLQSWISSSSVFGASTRDEHIDDQRVGDIRKRETTIRGQRNVAFQKKFRLPGVAPIDLDDYGVRIAFSVEETADEVTFEAEEKAVKEKGQQSVVRNIRRQSFFVSYTDQGPIAYIEQKETKTASGFRIDLSTVQHSAPEEKLRAQYEVEIELIASSGVEKDVARLASLLDQLFRIIYDTAHIYSFSEKEAVLKEVNTAVGKRGKQRRAVEARNLTFKDLVWGGLIGNERTSYTVTWKVDGYRKFLIVADRGIWIVYPPFEFNLLYRLSGGVDRSIKAIFDGELVPQSSRLIPGEGRSKPYKSALAEDLAKPPTTRYWYVIFDTVSHQESTDIQKKKHKDRMNIAQTFIREVGPVLLDGADMTVGTKSFRELTDVSTFYDIMRSMFSSMLDLPFREDGLVFTPENTWYIPQGMSYPLSERRLTKMADVCKWKEVANLSIDFLISRGASGRQEKIILYSGAIEEEGEKKSEGGRTRRSLTTGGGALGDKYVEFKGEITPFNSLTDVDFDNPRLIGIPTGQIVEFAWRERPSGGGGWFVPIRVRHDKLSPNRIDVALDNWRQIHKPITRETLQGESFALVRADHNKIKRKLLRDTALYPSVPGGRVLLDIGSGKGGDVTKWRKYSYVVAVEPNPENIAVLKKRIVNDEAQDYVTVIHAGGEQSDVILEGMRLAGIESVDVVSLMLSLTFFWKNEKMLQGLVSTISRALKPGGKIIFLTMDGSYVEEFFQPYLDPSRGLGKSCDGEPTVESQQMAACKKAALGLATIRYYPEESRVNIDIKDSATVHNQDEYLVHIADFARLIASYPHTTSVGTESSKLRRWNIESYRADKELLMSAEERQFSKFYIYGSITIGGKTAASQQAVDLQTNDSDVPALPSGSVIHKQQTIISSNIKSESQEMRSIQPGPGKGGGDVGIGTSEQKLARGMLVPGAGRGQVWGGEEKIETQPQPSGRTIVPPTRQQPATRAVVPPPPRRGGPPPPIRGQAPLETKVGPVETARRRDISPATTITATTSRALTTLSTSTTAATTTTTTTSTLAPRARVGSTRGGQPTVQEFEAKFRSQFNPEDVISTEGKALLEISQEEEAYLLQGESKELPEIPYTGPVPKFKTDWLPQGKQSIGPQVGTLSTGSVVGGIASNVDVSAPITTSWYRGLVRIATIGDGSCFFHAILNAALAEYQENQTQANRERLANEFRRQLADQVFVGDNWVNAGGGTYVGYSTQYLATRLRIDSAFFRRNNLKKNLDFERQRLRDELWNYYKQSLAAAKVLDEIAAIQGLSSSSQEYADFYNRLADIQDETTSNQEARRAILDKYRAVFSDYGKRIAIEDRTIADAIADLRRYKATPPGTPAKFVDLLKGSDFVGDEVVAFTSYILGFSICRLMIGEYGAYVADMIVHKPGAPLIVIAGTGGHYETVGEKLDNGLIRTVFVPSSNVYGRIASLVPSSAKPVAQGESRYDNSIRLAKDISDTLMENSWDAFVALGGEGQEPDQSADDYRDYVPLPDNLGKYGFEVRGQSLWTIAMINGAPVPQDLGRKDRDDPYVSIYRTLFPFIIRNLMNSALAGKGPALPGEDGAYNDPQFKMYDEKANGTVTLDDKTMDQYGYQRSTAIPITTAPSSGPRAPLVTIPSVRPVITPVSQRPPSARAPINPVTTIIGPGTPRSILKTGASSPRTVPPRVTFSTAGPNVGQLRGSGYRAGSPPSLRATTIAPRVTTPPPRFTGPPIPKTSFQRLPTTLS